MAPLHDGTGSPADSDQQLVARIRRGDDRAFEVLYQRYHRRIHAYVLGMVKDHGRAEDLTQEIFVSALRRMRATEQPLAFKPWLYQIAKNSCIDAFRRSRRAEEVSYDADDALNPGDQSRLVGSGPSPDAAVAAKEDLDNLCGAFGGLSETHHEILVLRELEGLSYQEIGRRMGMSRPAVESTLFRARRRLTEEYDDIVSGARCRRIQGIIVTAVQSRLGARDTRRLARHLSHCQSCRREALEAGLDRGLFARPSVRERVGGKLAGLLPIPAFLRLRGKGEDAAAAAPSGGGRGAALMSHLPMLSDQLSSGWGKAAAGVAVLIAGVGAGVGVTQHQQGASAAPAAIHAAPPAKSARAAASTPAATPTGTAATTEEASAKSTKLATTRTSAAKQKTPRTGAGKRTSSAANGQATLGSAPASTPAPAAAAKREPSSSSKSDSGSSGGGGRGSDKPAPSAPSGGGGGAAAKPVADAVQQTTGAVQQTTEQVTSAVQETTGNVTGAVNGTVETVTGPGPVPDTVKQVTGAADTTVKDVTGTVNKTVDGTKKAVDGILGGGG